MTEHPNYKYRPRRRKQNKTRAAAPTPVPVVNNRQQDMGSESPARYSSRMSPNNVYIPNSSALSPSLNHNAFSSPHHVDYIQNSSSSEYIPNSPSQNLDSRHHKAMNISSPLMQYNTSMPLGSPDMGGYQKMQMEGGNYSNSGFSLYQSSPLASNNYDGYSTDPKTPQYSHSVHIMHTPESSPTQSPEPDSLKVKSELESKKAVSRSPKTNDKNRGNNSSVDDNSAALPTPEMSPMELEKENYQMNEEKRQAALIANQNSLVSMPSSTGTLSPSVSNSAFQHKLPQPISVGYRQSSALSYSNHSAPITAMGMANGMYVMCTQRGMLDQGHIVTGTFFPPVATSQDHQTLGASPSTGTVSNTMSTISGGHSIGLNQQSSVACHDTTTMSYSTNSMTYPSYNQYNAYSQLPYKLEPKTDYQGIQYDKPNHYPYMNSPMGADHVSYIQDHTQTRQIHNGSPVSDVDTGEFDKYLIQSNKANMVGPNSPHLRQSGETMSDPRDGGSNLDTNHNYQDNRVSDYQNPHESYEYQNGVDYANAQSEYQSGPRPADLYPPDRSYSFMPPTGHTSVILQNTQMYPGKPPELVAPIVDGAALVTDAPQPQVLRPDDEFSVILAGVRQTCYSN